VSDFPGISCRLKTGIETPVLGGCLVFPVVCTLAFVLAALHSNTLFTKVKWSIVTKTPRFFANFANNPRPPLMGKLPLLFFGIKSRQFPFSRS